MNKITLIALGAALVFGCTANAAERKERIATKADVEQRIRDINRLDNDRSAQLAGLRAVSHETGIPVPQLEAQLKEHPKAGVAGLLTANEIASRSKVDVAQVYKVHGQGKAWVEIAHNHNVDLSGMDAKLNAVESAMKAGR